VGGSAGAATAFNEVTNNYLNHQENEERAKAAKKCADSGDPTACANEKRLDALDKQRDADFHAACDDNPSSEACNAATREMVAYLGTYAETDARTAATKAREQDDPEGLMLVQAHKDELQSYLDLIKVADPSVKTSTESGVRLPNEYDPDPYGVINKDNTKDAYLVMKFGTEALAIANTNEDGNYFFTDWAARNGMLNDPSYAAGLMLTHVDAAAQKKQDLNPDPNYSPVDRYTLSYAPTNGFLSDIWGTLLTKVGYESESVLGLRSQLEYVQSSGQQVNWVAHSRGGVEFVQAAADSSVKDLGQNSVVFHAGANTAASANTLIDDQKKISDVTNDKSRFLDAPNDLVPQIVGLRALTTNPFNIIRSLISAPCLSSTFCGVTESPHTLPYGWYGSQPQGQ